MQSPYPTVPLATTDSLLHRLQNTVYMHTYSVYIVLKLPWKIQVDDMCNTLHIETSTGHICGNKYLQTHNAMSRPGITAAQLVVFG